MCKRCGFDKANILRYGIEDATDSAGRDRFLRSDEPVYLGGWLILAVIVTIIVSVFGPIIYRGIVG